MKKKYICFTVLLSLFVILSAFTASAQVRAISGITITATHEIEPGTWVTDDDIDIDKSGSGCIHVSIDNANCYIDSCTIVSTGTKTVNVGDKVKLKAVISPKDETAYAFSGTYSSSNVRITGGGAFVSCSAKNGILTVTFTLKPISGPLNAPVDPCWKGTGTRTSSGSADQSSGPGSQSSTATVSGKTTMTQVTGPGSTTPVSEKTSSSKTSGTRAESAAGTARQNANIGKATWTAPEGTTGYYEVWLYKGSSLVHKFSEVKGTQVDCYPYMTKKGSYYFKVRTIPVKDSDKKYSSHSEWAVSDEFYIDETNVSNGSGQDVGTTGQVGWIKSGSTWYYKYPNGTLKKNGWELVNGKWYLFDAEGKMLTGKQSVQSGTYFLSENGDMQTGWKKIDTKWYYFNPDASRGTEGAMLKASWLNEADGKTYYLLADGAMATGWAQIGSYWYYFDLSGNLQRNTVIDTFRVDENGIWVQ